MAHAAGVDRTSVATPGNGKVSPTVETLLRLCRATASVMVAGRERDWTVAESRRGGP